MFLASCFEIPRMMKQFQKVKRDEKLLLEGEQTKSALTFNNKQLILTVLKHSGLRYCLKT